MKALILAAGNGTRMYPISLTTPKLMTPILNKTILERQVEVVKDFVNEVIVVISDPEINIMAKSIIDFVEKTDLGIKIVFAIQKEVNGTGGALFAAKDHIDAGEKFLCLNGDDLYHYDDIENMVASGFAVLGTVVKNPSQYGIFEADSNDNLIKIIEKPQQYVGNLANTGAYLLDSTAFDLFDDIEISPRGEYEITDILTLFAERFPMKVIETNNWSSVGTPWDMLSVQEKLVKLGLQKFDKIDGDIEKGVVIDGRVSLGKGSVIKSGTRIEGDVVIGENTIIGPSAYIRGTTTIGSDCKIGNFVEIKNSIVMDATKIPHLSYLADGVVGKNVNFGCGSKVANLRHDGETVKTMVKGKLMDTGRRKFSTVIGDNVKLGVDTLIYPGRKIWPNKTTRPGQIVTEDIIE